LIGTVKEYNKQRGYGVIIDSESGAFFTVYANYLVLKAGEELRQGQAVEFDVENYYNDKCTVNVKIL
jgi:cold shock CspA family protein